MEIPTGMRVVTIITGYSNGPYYVNRIDHYLIPVHVKQLHYWSAGKQVLNIEGDEHFGVVEAGRSVHFPVGCFLWDKKEHRWKMVTEAGFDHYRNYEYRLNVSETVASLEENISSPTLKEDLERMCTVLLARPKTETENTTFQG